VRCTYPDSFEDLVATDAPHELGEALDADAVAVQVQLLQPQVHAESCREFLRAEVSHSIPGNVQVLQTVVLLRIGLDWIRFYRSLTLS
jgi:hypothetical protein